MTVTQWIQSIIEIALVSVTLWGLFNEERISDWEQKTFRKIKRRFFK